MKKNYTFVILLLTFLNVNYLFSQVGIGTPTPASSLDVEAKFSTGTINPLITDGLLIPRVTRERAQSMTATPTSTMVYITEVVTGTAAGRTINVTSIGFYFYDGAEWQKIATGASTDWALAGNSGTTPGTNFIGTTGTQDIRIKTNSTDRWNISDTNNGQLQSYSLGTALLPTYSFQGDTNTGIFSSAVDNLGFVTNGTEKFRIPNANQVHAMLPGTALLPFYSFSNDTNTGLFNPTGDNISLATNGVEGFRMFNAGNVTIGATFAPLNAAPSNGLRVQGKSVIGKASGEDSRDIFSSHTSAAAFNNVTGYPNVAASRAISGYADSNGMGIFGFANRGGYGVVGLTQAGTISPFIQTGEGVLGQADGATGVTTIPIAVHGIIDESVAGLWRATGVLGENNNLTTAAGLTGGSYALTGSSSGIYGNYGTRFPTSLTDRYVFGVVGDILTFGGAIPDASGGVLGTNGTGGFGIIGYVSRAGTSFSVYGGGQAGTIAAGNTGRTTNNHTNNVANNHIGLGINGGFMGGYVKGNQYGLITKGKEFGMYVQGNTITNQPIIQLSSGGDSKKIITYTATSTEVDITTRGSGQLLNGKTFIAFKEAFKNLVSNNETINITVTPTAETKGVFISQVTKDGFYVKENSNGTSNASFNWIAIGTKKGYEKGIEVSETITNPDFDKNIDGATGNDGEKDEAMPIYFDGNTVKFERIPEHLLPKIEKKTKK